jgi:hypothetical protein
MATLCDVDACVVVYGEGESRMAVWPSAAEAGARGRPVQGRAGAGPVQQDDGHGGLPQAASGQDRGAGAQGAAREPRADREVQLLLHDAVAGRRPGLSSVEELASLLSVVEDLLHNHKVRKAIENLQASQAGGHQQGLLPAATALQVQLPQAASSSVSLPPLVPYAAPDVQAAQNLQYSWTWMMDVPRPGGELGAMVYGGGSGTIHQQGFGGAASVAAAGRMTHQARQHGCRNPVAWCWPIFSSDPM